MNRRMLAAMLLLHRIRRYRKQRRRYWVHPVNQKRDQVGTFNILIEQLRSDGDKFFNYFRMSVASFDELHNRLKNHIQGQNTIMRDCIKPMEMLAVTLRYLASGCTFTDLHHTFRIGVTTANLIVRKVCKAIWSVMRAEFLPTPSKEMWATIASGFEKTANFPHCIGAVDGKYIRLICPGGGSHKDIHSVVMMAVADSNYRFVYVNIENCGKDCDSAIFKRSELWQSIADGSHKLPEDTSLPGTDFPEVPYFFVGDEAFASHKHLLRPFGGTNLSTEKKVFNYRISRAQRYVECTFGILSNKWRIFHQPIKVRPDYAVDITKACVVLHNFIRDRDGVIFEETTTITGLEDLTSELSSHEDESANTTSEILCNYFVHVGAVPWQMSKV